MLLFGSSEGDVESDGRRLDPSSRCDRSERYEAVSKSTGMVASVYAELFECAVRATATGGMIEE